MSNIKDVDEIKDLIQVLKSGSEFYRDAKDEVKDSSLITTFENVATDHDECITRLQPFVVAQEGSPEDGSSWAVKAREAYTEVKAALTSNSDLTYVSQLEEVEDKLLEACDEALEAEQPLSRKTALAEVRSRLQKTHDRIRAIQHRKERAAS